MAFRDICEIHHFKKNNNNNNGFTDISHQINNTDVIGNTIKTWLRIYGCWNKVKTHIRCCNKINNICNNKEWPSTPVNDPNAYLASLSVSDKYIELSSVVKTQKGPFCNQRVSTLTLGSGCWANSRATKGQNTGVYLFRHTNNEKVRSHSL